MKTANTSTRPPSSPVKFRIRKCYKCNTDVLATNRGKKVSICFDCQMDNMKKIAKMQEHEKEELESVMGYH